MGQFISYKFKVAILVALTYFDFVQCAQVIYRVSDVHGLYTFAETVSGAPHRSKALLKSFDDHNISKDPNVLKAVEQFKKASRALDTGFNYEALPARPQGFYVGNLAVTQAILSTNLDDFNSRLLNAMPLKEQGELIKALRDLEAPYLSFIGTNAKTKLEKFRKKIETSSAHWNLSKMFEQARHFYASEWPKDQNFTIGLYPIPGSSGNSSAESIGGVESVGVFLEEADISGRFGVIFHELCHSLYETQPLSLQKNFEDWFLANASRHSRYAYKQINEALATALGNGWAAKIAKGSLDEGSWYSDVYINGFAKVLYPLVTEYLEKDKSLDKSFVDKAIKMYEDLFPHAPIEYDNLMNAFVLITNSKKFQPEVKESIFKSFRAQNVMGSSPINHPETLATIKEKALSTIIVVALPEDRGDLIKFMQQNSSLKKFSSKFKQKITTSLALSFQSADNRTYIIVAPNSASDLPKLWNKIKEAKVVDSAHHWVNVD